jgi:ribonuclease P protein subunit POP4
MALTARTLTRHELVGLPVRVAAASDRSLVGIEGRVVRETTNTLVIESPVPAETGGTATTATASDTPDANADATSASVDDGDGDGDGDEARDVRTVRCRQVPKAGATFEFRLTAPSLAPVAGLDGATPTTDEAAGDREAPGTAAERARTVEAAARTATTAGGGAAGPAGDVDARDADDGDRRDDAREVAASVTVDGSRLRTRPALRTEQTGVSTWR